jgi:hypothetical protein
MMQNHTVPVSISVISVISVQRVIQGSFVTHQPVQLSVPPARACHEALRDVTPLGPAPQSQPGSFDHQNIDTKRHQNMGWKLKPKILSQSHDAMDDS